MNKHFLVEVRVSGDASSAEDASVPGTYQLEVHLVQARPLDSLTGPESTAIAAAVLDLFHEKIGIDFLDDFAVSVHMPNGDEISEGAEADDDTVDRVEFLGKIDDPESLDVDALLEKASPEQIKSALSTLLKSLVDLGFDADEPINGGDAVDAIAESFNEVKSKLGSSK